MSLTFNALRKANRLRLPLFKNKLGALAHAKPDGSDWSPAQWLQAVVGELGEYARLRFDYEMGHITHEEFSAKAPAELADVQTYLDILAQRCLDRVDIDGTQDAAQVLQQHVADIGEYANERKKFDRGDHDWDAFDAKRKKILGFTARRVGFLAGNAGDHLDKDINPVREAHPTGVDLEEAVIEKFNTVSDRVGCSVKLSWLGAVESA
jgi:hypothetical protein